LPFQESLYQLRSNTTQPNEFVETPIFIGTASKLVTQTTGEGINVLAVSDLGSGLQFDFNKTEAHIKYWYLDGEYSVNAIDLSRKILFLTSLNEYYVMTIGEAQYNCFVRNGLTNETIFSSPIVDASFNADTGNNKYLASITLAEPIPSTLDLTQINFSISVCDIIEEDINSTQLFLDTNGVRLNTTPQNWIQSNNVQTIISVTWKFYYDVTDFRYITLNALDLIPDEYTSNKHNKLGQAYARHKVLSTTKASLLTVPSETFENFTQAISIFNEQGNTLGYFVTPLFYNDKIAPFLKSLAAGLAQDYIWSENFLSYSSLFDQTVIIQISAPL
jgi:hypothetical protein